MKQTLTFVVEWASFTPDRELYRFAQSARNAVIDLTKRTENPPYDHFMHLVESSDGRTTTE